MASMMSQYVLYTVLCKAGELTLFTTSIHQDCLVWLLCLVACETFFSTLRKTFTLLASQVSDNADQH